MKTKTLYTCEYCHTDYADKKNAEECERNHKLLKDAIIEPVYCSRNSDATGVPTKLLIRFKGSDKPVIYRR